MDLSELRRVCLKQNLDKRRMAMKLLYEVADCRLIDIPEAMGYSQAFVSNMNVHINELNRDMYDGTVYGNRLKREYKELLKHMNL
jgi:hypothetical protein